MSYKGTEEIIMKKYIESLSRSLLGTSYNKLDKPEQNIINSIADAEPTTENYKVSLKTDLEITRLHQKIDSLIETLSIPIEQC